MEQTPAFWKDLITGREFLGAELPLFVPLGRAEHEDVLVDLHSLRHMLICGDAETGKTTLVHAILNSLLLRCNPEHLRLIIIDPKSVEYQPYDSLAHMLTPVISDAKKAILALKWLNKEYERRLAVLKEHGMRTIEAYHEKVVRPAVEKNGDFGTDELPEAMPYLITVIDELSIPMAQYKREIQAGLAALAHSARSAGIHLIATTTRPDAQTLPTALREHFAARVVFHTTAGLSRAFVGETGAEGFKSGEAYFRPNAMTKATHMQTAQISDEEIDENVIAVAKRHPAEEIDPQLVPADKYWTDKPASIFSAMTDDDSDDRYVEAVEAIREAGQASTSYLQRKLGIGYSRAARLIDMLEERGVIAPGDGAAPRKVIDQDID